jgi:hypothetical protein
LSPPRNVEGAAAQVEHGDVLRVGLVEAAGEHGGGGLVEEPVHGEPGTLAGVLRLLALHLVEVGGHGDDGAVHRLAQPRLGALLEVAQHVAGHLGGGERLTVDAHRGVAGGVGHHLVGQELAQFLDGGVGEAPAQQSLHAEEGVPGVERALATRGAAHRHLARGVDVDDGGRGALPLAVGQHLGVAGGRIEPGHAAIGGAQVDSEDDSHDTPAPEARLKRPRAALPP